MAPAGALASTRRGHGPVHDRASQPRRPLLNPATAQLMYSSANKPFSALPAMALGFYHEDRNGLNIVGHGGDTVFFHSDLHLFLDKNVGLYISMNSVGQERRRACACASNCSRNSPTAISRRRRTSLPTASTAKADGAGDVRPLRQQPRRRVQLLAAARAARRDQRRASTRTASMAASTVTDPSGSPRKWREVGPGCGRK